MKKIRTVLIDDEKNSLIILSKLLERKCPQVEIVATGQSVAEGIDIINEHKPELVFLDISMPDGEGFEVLEKIDDTALEVVFVTAYNQYAIKAFEFSALHYLVKPVTGDQLKEAVDRFEEAVTEDITEKIQVLNSNIKKLDRLILPTSSGLNIIQLNEIYRCESSNNYTTFFLTNNKKIVVSKSIQVYEKMLSNSGFCRIHNKHVVNLKYIKKYVKGRGGYVVLTNDKQVDVSEGKKKNFLKELTEFTVN